MKKQNIFIALFLAAFVLPFFGSVSSAQDPNMPPPGPGHHDPNMPPPDGCDPNLAPDVEGACGFTGNHGGPNDHHGVDCAALPTPEEVAACENGPNAQHHDPNMPPPGPGHHDPNMPPPGGGDHPECPAGTTCGGPGDHHGDQEASHCAAMGMADGSSHVDPPQDIIDQVSAEYEANCKSGNCFLGEGNYKLLEGMGHTRAKVDCFLAEGHRQHDEQHGGPGDGNHPPAP